MSNKQKPKYQLHGHAATYIKSPSGLTRSVYRCACHGFEFETRPILRVHIKTFHSRIRKDFVEMVKLHQLGNIQPWDRLPGETALQYSRFKVYLRTEDPKTKRRSIERSAAITGQRVATAKVTAAAWHWSIRADLLDQQVELEEIQQFKLDKSRSARRQANVGRQLQAVALAGATRLLADADRVGEMSGNEIAKLADVGVKIERLASQDPTSISEDRSIAIIWDGPKPDWAPAESNADAHSLAASQPATIEGK